MLMAIINAIKNFFTSKPVHITVNTTTPAAPYKVEPPVVSASGNETLGNNTVSVAPSPEAKPARQPRAKKPAVRRAAAAKKAAAKKPTPTP